MVPSRDDSLPFHRDLRPSSRYRQGSPNWYAARKYEELWEEKRRQGDGHPPRVRVTPNRECPDRPVVQDIDVHGRPISTRPDEERKSGMEAFFEGVEEVSAAVPEKHRERPPEPAPDWDSRDDSLRSEILRGIRSAISQIQALNAEEPEEITGEEEQDERIAKIKSNQKLREAKVKAANALNRLLGTVEQQGFGIDVRGEVSVDDVDRAVGRKAVHGNIEAAKVHLRRRGELSPEDEIKMGDVNILNLNFAQLSEEEALEVRGGLMDKLAEVNPREK